MKQYLQIDQRFLSLFIQAFYLAQFQNYFLWIAFENWWYSSSQSKFYKIRLLCILTFLILNSFALVFLKIQLKYVFDQMDIMFFLLKFCKHDKK